MSEGRREGEAEMREHGHRGSSVAFLAAALVAAVGGAASGLCQDTEPERAVWYSFDWPDEPGRSVGRTPWPAYIFRAEVDEGKVGSGLRMAGEGANGLLLPNPAAFFGQEARAGTIALWVRPDFDPSEDERERVIIDFMKQAGNTLIDGYEIVILTHGASLAAQAALGRRMQVDSSLSEGRWTHLALAWDASLGSVLYVDGVKAAEMKSAFEPTPLTWWPGRAGAHTPSGGYPFKGAIDELRLFDRMLGDEEVQRVAQAGERDVALKVSGWQSDRLRIANRGAEPATVWLRCWHAESEAAAELWGGLPVPEHEFGSDDVYVGGASGSPSRASEAAVIAPGQTTSLKLPTDDGYCRWNRLSLMANEGLACCEVDGVDYQGLVCCLEPSWLAAKEPATLRLGLQNRLGRSFLGTVTGELADPSGQPLLTVPDTEIALKPGTTAALLLKVPGDLLQPGMYQLTLTASGPTTECRLRSVSVPVVEGTDYRTLFGVGAAYVGRTFGDDLMPAMAKDRVKVVRRGPGSWHNEPTEVVAQGLRMWYTPAFSPHSICTDPTVVEYAEQLARSLGTCLREKPTALNQIMAGEGLSRQPCYCNYCNAAFREYLEGKYRDIIRLNEAWGADYDDFREIHQIGSPRDVSEAADRMALMQRELPEAHAARWRELFRLDPSRAIEWKRWHDQVLVDWYERFATAFHETNEHHTALSEQPCWPDFKHHVLFALGEIADLGGMDLYLPGELPTTLGYASELFMNFDLNASIFQGKPLWVHELYVQDNSPPLLPEAQGWFLVGRGYSMLTYFTYDYYKEGIRANLPLIFGLFDEERQPYPAYPSFARFGEQMEAFHTRYDAFSLRREEPRVALFLGDDISLANSLETGGETWGAAGVHGHIGAYWLAERNGHPVEFINDDQFSLLKGKQSLIVPWTHVIRPASLKAILQFARSGGTVILDGPIALHDENYRPYAPIPGGTAMGDLGIQFANYRDAPNSLVVGEATNILPGEPGTEIASQGVPVDLKLAEWRTLAGDRHGNPALIHRTLGQGQVFWFLTNMGRVHRGRAPDPNAAALWRGVIEAAGIKSRHVVRAGKAVGPQPGAADLDHGGKGLPEGDALCDASVRLRGDDEAFVFLVSFFDGTQGRLLLRTPSGTYEATDAITEESIPIQIVEDGLSLPIDLPSFGSRVVRVKCLDGAPFAEW